MRLLADENIDRLVIAALRAQGHTVTAAAAQAPGAPDQDVLQRAGRARAVVLTEDRDFGELVVLEADGGAGVILVRLPGLSRNAAAERIATAVATLEASGEPLPGAVAVVEAGRVRIRHRGTPP